MPMDETMRPPQRPPQKLRRREKSRCELTIYSIGHESMGLPNMDYTAIQKWFEDNNYGSIDIVVNCKHWGEPPAAEKHLTPHPGFHASNIAHLTQYQTFRTFLSSLRSQIQGYVPHGRKLQVALVCRHGRHRS